MKNIVILGAGGTAFEVIEIIKAMNHQKPQWNILGYLDDNESLIGKEVHGFKVLGNIASSKDLRDVFFTSSIGNAYDTQLRKRVRQRVPFSDDCFATLIHPNATICETAKVDPGAIIYSNVCISANAHVGHDSFIVYNSVVAHESTVGRHSILSVGVLLPSDVHIGDCCYVGVGAVFRNQLEVGDNCLIGMGSKVVKSVPANTKFMNKLENLFTPLENVEK